MRYSYLKTITKNVLMLANIFVLVWFVFLFVCLYVCFLSPSWLVLVFLLIFEIKPTMTGKRIICLCHEIVTVLHKKSFPCWSVIYQRKMSEKLTFQKRGKQFFLKPFFFFFVDKIKSSATIKNVAKDETSKIFKIENI